MSHVCKMEDRTIPFTPAVMNTALFSTSFLAPQRARSVFFPRPLLPDLHGLEEGDAAAREDFIVAHCQPPFGQPRGCGNARFQTFAKFARF